MPYFEEATALALNRSSMVGLLPQMIRARDHDTFRNLTTHLRDFKQEVQQAVEDYEEHCAEHECDNVSKR
jgi:hypothetical protein